MASIVESLLRQREESIREEYDKVLHEKLQGKTLEFLNDDSSLMNHHNLWPNSDLIHSFLEQYEIWCRYNQDQLQQHRPTSSSNYIS